MMKKDSIVNAKRFEAVFYEHERLTKWAVVEWTTASQKDGTEIRSGEVVWSTHGSPTGGLEAKVIAKKMNEEYYSKA